LPPGAAKPPSWATPAASAAAMRSKALSKVAADEQCVRNVLIRGEYQPTRAVATGDDVRDRAPAARNAIGGRKWKAPIRRSGLSAATRPRCFARAAGLAKKEGSSAG